MDFVIRIEQGFRYGYRTSKTRRAHPSTRTNSRTLDRPTPRANIGLQRIARLLVFYGMEFYFIEHAQPGLGSIAAISGSVVLTALYLIAKRTMKDQSLGSQTVILIFITLTLVHAVHIEMLPGSVRPWALPVGLLFLAFRRRLPVAIGFQGPWRIPIVGMLAILGMEFLGLTFRMVSEFLEKKPRFGSLGVFTPPPPWPTATSAKIV